MGKKNSPGNREVIHEHIKKTYGVDYSLTAIGKLLKRNGLKSIRAKTVPGKPPELEKQVEFALHYHQTKEFRQNDPGIVQFVMLCESSNFLN